MSTNSTSGARPPAATSIGSLVGRTPLLRLEAFEPRTGVELYAKIESRNPGGSVKDRAALAMIEDGERRGALTVDRILLDATSGNTGVAYAMLAAARGYRVRLCVPANVTPERLRLMRAYGAEIRLTDPMEGSDGAIREARRLFDAEPDLYFYPDQYNNPLNWQAHFDTTGPEIIEQTGGRITHFVAGLGTSGTFIGTGRHLRGWRPSVRLISVEPDSPLHGLEGLKHMASAIVPGIYDPTLADDTVRIGTEEAHGLTRRLARNAGLLAGPSSGAALGACLRLARAMRHGVIVTVFPDSGERYLTESLWRDGPPWTWSARTRDRAAGRCGRRDSPPCRGGLSGRMLRRAARPRCRLRGRSLPARQPDDRRAATALRRHARRLSPRRSARRRLRTGAARLLPFASRPPGRAIAVRSRSCVAESELRHRLRAGGPDEALRSWRLPLTDHDLTKSP